MGFVFIVFDFWRVIDLLISYIAKMYDRYEEHFRFKYIIVKYSHQIPHFLASLANYDGAHYLYIARFGYHQYEQAFFPLFPLLVRLSWPFFGSSAFLAGLFIPNVGFLIGLYFFKRYLDSIWKKQKQILWLLLILV